MIEQQGTDFLDVCIQMVTTGSYTPDEQCRMSKSIAHCFAEAHNWSASSTVLHDARATWCAHDHVARLMLDALDGFLLDTVGDSKASLELLFRAKQTATEFGESAALGLFEISHALCTVLRIKKDRLVEAQDSCDNARRLYFQLRHEHNLPVKQEIALMYENASLLRRKGRLEDAFRIMSSVLEFDQRHNPHDLWYDVPLVAQLGAHAGNITY